MQEESDDVDHSRPGSGVWEKSDNSRWIVVAEGSQKIPRTRLASEGSVDPGLSIQTFISSFEVELPRVGEQSSLVSDGSSLVRFDHPLPLPPVLESDDQDSALVAVPGPSGVSNTARSGAQERNKKNRKQKKRKNRQTAHTAKSQSVESSPGRDCPSPDSLVKILHQYQHQRDECWMMAETPGERLMREFPNIEASVVSMILENVNYNAEKASELLLEMSGLAVAEAEFPALGAPGRHLDDFPSVEVAWGRQKPPPAPAVIQKSSSLTSIGRELMTPSHPQEADCLAELEAGDSNVLVVMRGLPGSGKTTLARRLVKSAGCGVILSTDDYFYEKGRGQYVFRPEQLSEAHAYNQQRASEAVKNKIRLIIIDNTNTCSWEMRPYIELGLNNFYKLRIIEPNTDWKFKPRLLAQKNSHGVPKQKIEAMLERYEKDLSLEKLLSQWKLTIPVKPPRSPLPPAPSSDIQEAASSSTDETFQSDCEDIDETEELNILNPEVDEFIPCEESGEPQMDPGEEMGDLLAMFPHLTADEVSEMYSNQTINMNLDPKFAVTLQEHFGELAPPQYLGKLPQEEILSLDISLNLAKVIFTLWQQSVLTKLNDDNLVLVNNNISNSPALIPPPLKPAWSEPPKTVLAPNAVSYYENQMISQAVQESKSSSSLRGTRKKPTIVIKENHQADKESNEETEEVSQTDLEQLIEQRNSLYKKAMDAKGTHMQGIRSYYSSQARELNTLIKASQKEKQLEMFINANKSCPSTRLDLHYLQTGDAVKQLSAFISQWEKVLTEGKKPNLAVEIVTGRGNRSDHGKSRLRPAVTNWLLQKNYSYSDVNEGCLKVMIRPRS